MIIIDRIVIIFQNMFHRNTENDKINNMNKLLLTIASTLISSCLFSQWTKIDSLDVNNPNIPNGGEIYQDNQNNVILFGSTISGFSNDGGYSWIDCQGIPNDHQLRSVVFNGSSLLGATIETSVYGGAIIESTDNGQNWTLKSSFGGRLRNLYYSNGKYVVSEYYGPGDPNNQILISSDGTNWSNQFNNSDNNSTPIGATTDELIVSSSEYLGNPGEYRRWFHFYSTINSQWDSLDILAEIGEPYDESIASVSFKNDIGLLITESTNRVYTSNDGGHTWTQKTTLSNPISSLNYQYGIEIVSSNHYVVFGKYNSNQSLYTESVDGANTWSNSIDPFLEVQMDNSTISDMNYLDGNTALCVTSSYNNIAGNSFRYIWNLGSNVGVDIDAIQSGFKIFPNPSNGQFNITGIEGGTSITIVNSQGQLIYEQKNLNQKDLILDLDIPNGLYFVKIQSNGAVQTVRMVINK